MSQNPAYFSCLRWHNKVIVALGVILSLSCNKPQTIQLPPQGLAGSVQNQPVGDTKTIMGQVTISGTVIEALSAEGMCYVKIQDKTMEEAWFSILQECPPLNRTITLKSELAKTNFLSQQLNRRFEKLYFGVLMGK